MFIVDLEDYDYTSIIGIEESPTNGDLYNMYQYIGGDGVDCKIIYETISERFAKEILDKGDRAECFYDNENNIWDRDEVDGKCVREFDTTESIVNAIMENPKIEQFMQQLLNTNTIINLIEAMIIDKETAFNVLFTKTKELVKEDFSTNEKVFIQTYRDYCNNNIKEMCNLYQEL